MEHIGSLYNYWHFVHDIAIDDEIAYIASSGNGLIAVDFENPEEPGVVGSHHVNNSYMEHICIAGDFAYTICDLPNCVRILDISDPENIREVSVIGIDFRRTTGIVHSNGLLFVGTWSNAEDFNAPLFIYNVVDPENPELLSTFVPPDENIRRGDGRGVDAFDVEGNLVYVANQHEDLFVVNIEDPENPEIEAVFSTERNNIGKIMKVRDRRIYVGNSVFRIIDYNEENEFELLNEHIFDFGCKDWVITGDEILLYSLHSSDFVYAADVSNPEDFGNLDSIEIGNQSAFALCQNILLSGSTNHYEGLFFIDVSDPGDMQLISELNQTGQASRVECVGEMALISGRNNGLKFVDISNPNSPEEIGVYNPDALWYLNNFVVFGNLIYLVDDYYVRTISFANPEEPEELASVFDLRAVGIAMNDRFLFTVGNGPGISVYSIANPEEPELIAHSRVVGAIRRRIAVSGDRLFVQGRNGVIILDVENPEENIEQVGFIETNVQISTHLIINGNYLCVLEPGSWADGNGRPGFLTFIDIERIEEARVLSTVVPRQTGAWDVDIVNDYAFVATREGGISLYDISDPENPEEIGWYDTSGGPTGVDMEGNLGFVANTTSFDVYDLSEAMLFNNHPLWDDFPYRGFEVDEGDSVEFIIRAQNLQNITIDLIQDDLPDEGISFEDRGRGRAAFLWITDHHSAGEYLVRFVATHGEQSDTVGVPITVQNVNVPPVIISPIPDFTLGLMEEPFTVAQLDTVFSDPDDQILNYEVLCDTDSLISNLIDENLLILSTEPGFGDNVPHLVRVLANNNFIPVVDSFTVTINPLSVEEEILPTQFVLNSAYPNPFNSTTTIKYTVPLITRVSLQVYDINGRLVETLVDGEMPAGRHSVVWDAGEVGAGVYFVRMKDERGGMKEMRKVVLVK